MQEMMDHFADLTLSVMSRVLDALDVPIDHAQWWEDMAYNAGPLISPKHVRHLMLPGYRRVNDYLRKRGVDVISVDSDGKIDALIPIWLDSGINCMFPNEVAAGNDVFAMRAKYGRDLLLIGGIDKRALAEGKPAIRQELERRLPLVTQGGYIPEIDHSVPHDISFEDYQYYHRTLQEESLRYLREWAA
jgi:uroporphyrinogen decarboxylase